jgi:hypothetical protein
MFGDVCVSPKERDTGGVQGLFVSVAVIVAVLHNVKSIRMQ